MNPPFKIACQTDQLAKVRDYVRTRLDELRVPEAARNLMVVAVDEICANLIIHSNKSDARQSLEITIDHCEDDMLVFEIVDYGLAFDPESYLEPTVHEIVKRRKKGGIGILLVRRIMDKIEYERQAQRNVCRLLKKFPGSGSKTTDSENGKSS